MEVRIEDGALHEELPVFGCYLHGIFENRRLRENFLGSLRRRKGLSTVGMAEEWESLREQSLDRLADIVSSTLDMEAVYSLLGLGERSLHNP
jgi:adenosylcobyric acid synthase